MTICETISGDGNVLPQVIIIADVIHQERRFITTDIDDDTLLAVSDTSCLNDMLGLERFSAQRQHGVYRLLCFMGMVHTVAKSSFISATIIESSIPFCLPPHSTHILQPLDVVFQPYKHFYAEAIDVATSTGCLDFNKLEFLAALTSVRKQTVKRTTVLSTF